jgi:hypothetical protein
MMIARRFERVSDQARNICMETLYLCTGEHPKHPGSDQVRVLFVDEHHAVGADGRGDRQGAGIAAVSSSTARGWIRSRWRRRWFGSCRKKGSTCRARAPKAIHQIPDLDHYQVVVALSPEVRRAFPKQPRKLVYLDWGIENPARAGLGPEQRREAWPTAYGQIDAHIRDLVQAVLGTEATKAGASDEPGGSSRRDEATRRSPVGC